MSDQIDATDIPQTISQLFDAERRARDLHDRLVDCGDGSRKELLSAIDDAVKGSEGETEDEAAMRLVCVARLLGEFEGGDVADRLIDVLNTDYAEARSEAGEQLQGLAFERFKDVALAAERALERFSDGGPALLELPYLLVEVPEGGVVKLLGKFLASDDGDVVAGAIEALAEIGDPAAVRLLLPLQGDERSCSLGDEDLEEGDVTVGELAMEAIELLQVSENAEGA